jgi:Cu/Ag efflux pump CusA
LLAVTPILFLQGFAGALLSPLVVSFVLALLASTAIAVSVTPALALLLLSRRSGEHRLPPVLRWLEARYHRGLSRILSAPHAALVLTCAVLLAGLAAVPTLGWSLLPSFKETDVRIAWEGPAGTSHPEMRRILTQASRELRLIPGVRNVSAHVGRAVTGDQVVGIESGQLWVNIDAAADYEATLAGIRDTVRGYPGFEGKVQTYLRARMEEVLAGADDPIVLRIEGPERAVLRHEAEKVLQMLAGISGVVNPRVEDESQAPEVEIRVDLSAAGRAGLKPGDVRRAAATAFAGLEVGNLFEQQKVFDVVVWGAPGSRQSLNDLREFLIDTPDGGHVRLADVAAVDVVPTPRVFTREGVSRYIDVRAGVVAGDVGAVARDVKDRLRKIAFPFEYHAFLVDDYAQQQMAKRRALIAMLAAAIGAFFLLQASSQSWRLAALCFPVLLAALAGGVLAMIATSGTVFLGSLAGLLAVLALAARNSIVLIARCRHLEDNEGMAFGRGLVLRAARERLGATVTTVVAAGLALLAVTWLGERAGLEVLHPAAVVIVGGLLTTAIVSLFAVPALYLRFAGPRLVYRSAHHAA